MKITTPIIPFCSFTFLVLILAGCSNFLDSSSSEIGTSTSTSTTKAGSQYNPTDFSYTISGPALYVDQSSGDDSNDGSQTAPFATILQALETATGGEVIYVADGDYGDLRFGAKEAVSGVYVPIEEVFTDWVTIKPVEGASPTLGQVILGTNMKNRTEALTYTDIGNSDLRLRIDGMQINNRALIYGSRYVDIRNCLVMQDGDFASMTDTEKANYVGKCALLASNGEYITFLNNEITDAALGVILSTTNCVFKGNNIHNNVHDGIQAHWGTNIVIENNIIHDLDDGVGDDDKSTYGNHVDGMQLYPLGTRPLRNFTFRGNFIYHIEAQDIMINTGYYYNFLFENNIFGPSNGYMFNFGSEVGDGFVFRNNTVLYTPNDQWTSDLGKTFGSTFSDRAADAYRMYIWNTDTNSAYAFYNNILVGKRYLGDGTTYTENNLYYTESNDDGVLTKNRGYATTTAPYGDLSGALQTVIDSGVVPGTPTSDSYAIDNGVTNELGVPELDFNQNKRDSKPDIGAIEI